MRLVLCTLDYNKQGVDRRVDIPGETLSAPCSRVISRKPTPFFFHDCKYLHEASQFSAYGATEEPPPLVHTPLFGSPNESLIGRLPRAAAAGSTGSGCMKRQKRLPVAERQRDLQQCNVIYHREPPNMLALPLQRATKHMIKKAT